MTLAWIAAVLVVLVAARYWIRRTWLVVTVHGQSMIPTLRDGQRVVARLRLRAPLVCGDVIVFALRPEQVDPARPDDPVHRVKRVAAIAGDPVPAWLPCDVSRVPDDHVVIVGDNPQSEDSRQLGFIHRQSVLGVVRVACAAG
jgi:signal peptidase I